MSTKNKAPKKAIAGKGKRLTAKQKKFADGYNEHGNKARAIREAGYNAVTPFTQSSMGVENLKKPLIKEYLISVSEQCATNIKDIANDKEIPSNVRLRANESILDRAGFGAISKSESAKLNINVEMSIDDKEELKNIRALLGKK